MEIYLNISEVSFLRSILNSYYGRCKEEGFPPSVYATSLEHKLKEASFQFINIDREI